MKVTDNAEVRATSQKQFVTFSPCRRVVAQISSMGCEWSDLRALQLQWKATALRCNRKKKSQSNLLAEVRRLFYTDAPLMWIKVFQNLYPPPFYKIESKCDLTIWHG
jgi:hypothetical protein